MIHSVRFTAVLDTNVIYPVLIRDILLWFAQYDLYSPKWFLEMVLNKNFPDADYISNTSDVTN
jgi:hypothetical protein